MEASAAKREEIPFITDDQAAKELRAVANGLHDLEASIPSLARRLEAVAEKLWPSGSDDRVASHPSEVPDTAQTHF